MNKEDKLKEIFKTLHEACEYYGEDSDFQNIDEAHNKVWKQIFDLVDFPKGRARSLRMAAWFDEYGYEGTNLQEAIKRGWDYYDTAYD